MSATRQPTQQPTGSRPRLLSAEPQLFVTDMARACAFYTGTLGCEIAFLHGEPPFYGQVHRDGARLNLKLVDEPVFHDAHRRRETLLSASIVADDVDQLHREFVASGADIRQPPRTEPWGARTLIVADPDGNLLLFAASAADASQAGA